MTDKNPKRPRDPNQLAKSIIDDVTGDASSVDAVTKNNRKHVGGKKGGKARATALTPEDRVDIARTAAMARWKKAT